MLSLARACLIVAIAISIAGCAVQPETNSPTDISTTDISTTGYQTQSTPVDETTTAPAPSLHAGDEWTDKVMDSERKFIVGAAKPDGTMFVNQWGNQIATTADLNIKTWRSPTYADASPTYFDPTMKWFDFPLAPGKTWHATSNWKDPDQALGGTAVCDGAAGKWEKINVPAGDYDALRVDVACRMFGRGGAADDINVTYWWVPSVNRFVKYS